MWPRRFLTVWLFLSHLIVHLSRIYIEYFGFGAVDVGGNEARVLQHRSTVANLVIPVW